MPKFIGVIGGSEASDELLRLAERVGKLIASEGCVLVCGGLGGVMEAAARGAKSARGLTVGVLPGCSRFDANPYIDVAIATNMGHARNAIIAHTSDSLIAIGGAYGTLSEMAFGLVLGKKVISLKSWSFDPRIVTVETPSEAVEEALKR